MFDRNQWLEWAKNSQNNAEMKDSMFDVRKNDQTRSFLYENKDSRPISTEKDKRESGEMEPPSATLTWVAGKLGKIPKVGKHIEKGLKSPSLRGGTTSAATWKGVDIVHDLFPSKRKEQEKLTASTRIVPNPTEESVQFDEAAFLLPLLALAGKVGGAAAAAGGALGSVGGLVGGTVARSAIGHGIKKLATSGIRKVAKNPLRRVKSLGKEVAGHAVMSKAMGGGQRPENLAVSTRNESTEQLDEFIGKLLRGLKQKPKITRQVSGVKNLSSPSSYTSGLPVKTPKVKTSTGIPLSQASGAKVKHTTGTATPPSQTRFQKILDKFKAPATQLAKTYGSYWLMGKAMGGAQPKDPMATQAQSTADAQAAASDRTTAQQTARKPSAPLPTHSR